jgi:hypothetical protein
LVPGDLAPKLYDVLRGHFADDPSVEVIVERRDGERRSSGERRVALGLPLAEERRRIMSMSGRRAGERRASAVHAALRALPRKARPYIERLVFAEPLPPTDRRAEDLDTARLITGFQSGDRQLFAILYMRHFDRVYSYLRILLGDPHEAEDVSQQVFLSVFIAASRFARGFSPSPAIRRSARCAGAGAWRSSIRRR